MCVCISQPRWIPPKRPMGSGPLTVGWLPPPFLTSKELSSPESFLDLENEKYVVSYLLSGQGPASSLNCPAILILEYRFTGNKSPIAYPGGGGGGGGLWPIYLLPQFPALNAFHSSTFNHMLRWNRGIFRLGKAKKKFLLMYPVLGRI